MTIEEVRSAMLALVKTAETEQRGLTAEEQTKFDALDAQKRAMEAASNLEAEQRAANTDMRVTNEKRDFSILRAINNVMANRAHEGAEADLIKRGREAFAHSGVVADGYQGYSIMLPTEERSMTAANASAAIATNIETVLDPLYYADALRNLGITRMSGLSGNISIPAYSGTTVAWAGETAAAADGTGTISTKNFSPKRLTAKVVFSKQFLLQDSASVEAAVRRDLSTAISHKVQQTIFGAAAAASNSPAGIFNGIAADTTAKTYADIVAMETKMEKNKMMYNPKYLLSLEAKEALRQIGVGTSTTSFGFVFDGGNVLGTQAVVSGNVAAKGIALADWREYVLCQWGGLDITVDPYSLATSGQIQLVVNAYFDGGFRRDNAFTAAILK